VVATPCLGMRTYRVAICDCACRNPYRGCGGGSYGVLLPRPRRSVVRKKVFEVDLVGGSLPYIRQVSFPRRDPMNMTNSAVLHRFQFGGKVNIQQVSSAA
jgi:hypothetical protein